MDLTAIIIVIVVAVVSLFLGKKSGGLDQWKDRWKEAREQYKEESVLQEKTEAEARRAVEDADAKYEEVKNEESTLPSDLDDAIERYKRRRTGGNQS